MAVCGCARLHTAVQGCAQLFTLGCGCAWLCPVVHGCARLCVPQTCGRWVSCCEGAASVGKFQPVGSGGGCAGAQGGQPGPRSPCPPAINKKTRTKQNKPGNNNGSIRGAGAQRAGSFPARAGACCHIIVSPGLSWPSPSSPAPPLAFGSIFAGFPGAPPPAPYRGVP